MCISGEGWYQLTDSSVPLLSVLLQVVLDAGLEESQFGSELLRLGEQQVLVPR